MNNEYKLQLAVCNYIKLQYPSVLFHSDLSGVRLTLGIAKKMKAIQMCKGFPDLIIYKKKGQYSGLVLELKAVDIYKKDGYLRTSEHLQEQKEVLSKLTQEGFKCYFSCGFDSAKQYIDEYLK